MDVVFSTEQVLNAVLALLDGRDVQEADEYLRKFSETEVAWSTCVDLISTGPHPAVQQFVASILVQKIRRDWRQLEAGQRAELFAFLVQTAENQQVDAGLQTWLCLCLATCAVKSPESIRSTVHQCAGMGWTGLELLSLLPNQVESADVVRQARRDLEEALHESLPQVLAIVRSSFAQLTDHDAACKILSTLQQWANYGLNFVVLLEQFSDIADKMFSALEGGDSEVVSRASDALNAIVNAPGDNAFEAKVHAADVLMERILLAAPKLHAYFAAEDPSEVAFDLCTLLATAGEYCLFRVCAPEGYREEYFGFMLELLRHPSKRLATITFDFWAILEDVPRSARNPTLQHDVFVEVLSRLVTQCTYPASWTVKWERETAEGEEFTSFRQSQETGDLLVMCYDAIGAVYFKILLDLFNADSSEWQRLEVLTFSVRAVIRPLKKLFDSHRLPQEAVEFLHSLTEQLCNLDLGSVPDPLAETACRLMGALTFLLAPQHNLSSPLQPLLTNVALSMQGAVAITSVQTVALEGLKQLCFQCGDALRAEQNFVDTVVKTTYEMICSKPFDPFVSKLVEVVVKFVSFMEVNAALKYVEVLSRPAVTCLVSSSEQRNISQQELVGTLTLLAQVIRSCDLATSGETHLAMAVLAPIWTHIQAIVSVFIADATVMESVFAVCIAALKAVGLLAHELINDIKQWAVDSFQQSFVPSAVECAGVLLETVSGVADQSGFLHDLLLEITSIFEAAASRGIDTSNVPDVVYQFCRLINNFVTLRVDVIGRSDQLHRIAQCVAICTGQSTERLATRESLKAVQNFCHCPQAPVDIQHQMMTAISPLARHLAAHITGCLIQGVPSTLKLSYVDALYYIIQLVRINNGGSDWMFEILSSAEMGLELSSELKAALASSMFSLNRNRFKSLVSDFSAIANGELNEEALLAYTLN